MIHKNKTFLAWGVGLIWLLATATGFASLWQYENTARAQPTFGQRWPAASHIPLDEHLFTLVIFMHPECPCSKASVADLSRLMTLCQGRVIARAVFIRPAAFSNGWEQTGLWRPDAAAIPGTFVSCDPGGVDAKLFGAMTSGQTALYDPAGQLLFQGGITESRGHAGDNPGCDTIEDIVLHHGRTAIASTRPGETAVFGCPLFNKSSATDARSNPR